jgi:pimeloyl-ACP methyl ester carboxylesterase
VTSHSDSPVASRAETGEAHVGARALRWRAAGEGAPVVVLEAGLGGSSYHWGGIPEALAQTTRVVAYDRAGYGGSDPVRHVTADQVLADLDAVLDACGADGPLVLVGHSWGGALARLYAAARPDRVAALVLLDATHENLRSSHSAALARINSVALRLMAGHARLGLRRRSLQRGKGQLARLLATLPAESRSAAVEELSRPDGLRQARRELTTVAPLLRLVASAAPPTIPVVAVVGAKAGTSAAATRQRSEMRSVYDAWITTIAHGQLVLAADRGHAVQLDEPGLVVDVVRDVLAQVRRGAIR